jgi:hypothetical protein
VQHAPKREYELVVSSVKLGMAPGDFASRLRFVPLTVLSPEPGLAGTPTKGKGNGNCPLSLVSRQLRVYGVTILPVALCRL